MPAGGKKLMLVAPLPVTSHAGAVLAEVFVVVEEGLEKVLPSLQLINHLQDARAARHAAATSMSLVSDLSSDPRVPFWAAIELVCNGAK